MKEFRATIDHEGNVWRGPDPVSTSPEWARPLELHDLETNRYRIVTRTLYRRKPFFLTALIFFRSSRGTPVFRLGRKPGYSVRS